jgi:hypothetical protein
MQYALKDFGDKLLGAEREDRRIRAVGRLVAAHTWSRKQSEQAQRIPTLFLDALEDQLTTATGGRRRGLLEVYDIMLDAIEGATHQAAA